MADLAFADRFAMLVESQWLWKESRALTRRLALAKLKQKACLEDIDFRHARGLDKTRLLHLTHESLWVAEPAHDSAARSDRHRQDLSGLRLGSQGLPRRLQRTVHAHAAAVPRTARRAGRTTAWAGCWRGWLASTSWSSTTG